RRPPVRRRRDGTAAHGDLGCPGIHPDGGVPDGDAVHGHPALPDEGLRLPAGGHAGPGQHLGQPLPAVLIPRVHGPYCARTWTIISNSTAAPRGRVLTPTAARAWRPASPNSSPKSSEAPLMTWGCWVKSSVLLT